MMGDHPRKPAGPQVRQRDRAGDAPDGEVRQPGVDELTGADQVADDLLNGRVAVEISDMATPVRALVARHEEAFAERLVAAAAEASAAAAAVVAAVAAAEVGAFDLCALGRRLAVLFEGAAALSRSMNATRPFSDARGAAETLLDVALFADARRAAEALLGRGAALTCGNAIAAS
ncbi:hypothetical protein E1298_39280 [Actinomadura rubrisoli]|uniref:Uncharacterized protein n=2 Tax=Actinomadura rubrisoli TaxID=2530368 RepID=A0A4R5A8Y5_9ACTN|nr:hypothetical protein E1298_39280 [Actinomadura rubrisoli]